MNLKLIATDMDGTFLKDNRTFNNKLMSQLLDEMDKQDIKFVAASGNQLQQLKKYFNEVNPDRIDYVSDNGSVVTLNNNIIMKKTLDKKQISDIINWGNENLNKNKNEIEYFIILSGLKGTYISNKVTENFEKEISQYYINVKVVDKLLEVEDEIVKVTFVSKDPTFVYNTVKLMRQKLANKVHITGSGFNSVDILPYGMNKEVGLTKIGEVLNIKSSEMAAFGDNANDLEMLRYVGQPFIMPNAEAFMHERIKNVAVADNNQDGVLKTIEKLLKENK